MTPQVGNGDGQQQAFKPVGTDEPGVIDIKTALLVIPEALLDGHAHGILA